MSFNGGIDEWGIVISPILFKGRNNVELDLSKMPKHVAIIMDGNGRWAQNRNLPRTSGHMEGIKRVEEIIDVAAELRIKALTLFTFSTENWQRPAGEVSILMRTMSDVLRSKVDKLNRNNTRFQMIGRREGIPPEVWDSIHSTTDKTKSNTGMVLNMAFNYGARLEIVDAIKSIIRDVKQGALEIDDISEDTVSRALYTHGLPDPDLLIRTSGEQRISNFLLWQLSYAEFYFTDKCWPDFNRAEFEKAIMEYQNRERRYGAVKES